MPYNHMELVIVKAMAEIHTLTYELSFFFRE